VPEGFRDYVKVERKSLLRVTRENILELAEEFDLTVMVKEGKAYATSRTGGIAQIREGDLIEENGRSVSYASEWEEADRG